MHRNHQNLESIETLNTILAYNNLAYEIQCSITIHLVTM